MSSQIVNPAAVPGRFGPYGGRFVPEVLMAPLEELEQAYKAPDLTATSKAALDDAKVKALAAFKKDDDTTCHKAIAEGFTKVGMTLK